MKLAVIGSRSITDTDLTRYITDRPDEIISGGARGIDTLAAAYAEANGIPLTVFLPDYARYGRSATHIRNRLIIEHADSVLAIWDGKSRGTLSSIGMARRLGKRLVVVNPYDDEDVPVLQQPYHRMGR